MAESAARRTTLVVTNGRIGKVWVDLIKKVYSVFNNCKLITINLIASFLQQMQYSSPTWDSAEKKYGLDFNINNDRPPSSFDHLEGYLPNSTPTVGLESLSSPGVLQAVQLFSML